MNFKEMRRSDRALSNEEQQRILAEGLYGVLSTCGTGGYAYGVPMSYVCKGSNIYLHAALEGQKLEAIKANNQVSFCVVGSVETLPGKFSTKYESVIVFGKASIIEGAEKEEALMALIEKYSPEFIPEGKTYMEKAQAQTAVIKIAPEHTTGKARR